jgi:hypothetical protein
MMSKRQYDVTAIVDYRPKDLDGKPRKQSRVRRSRPGDCSNRGRTCCEGLYGVRWVKMGSLVTSLKMTKATKAMMMTKAA